MTSGKFQLNEDELRRYVAEGLTIHTTDSKVTIWPEEVAALSATDNSSQGLGGYYNQPSAYYLSVTLKSGHVEHVEFNGDRTGKDNRDRYYAALQTSKEYAQKNKMSFHQAILTQAGENEIARIVKEMVSKNLMEQRNG